MNCAHCHHEVQEQRQRVCPACGKPASSASGLGMAGWLFGAVMALLPGVGVFTLLTVTPSSKDIAFEVGLIGFGGSFISGVIGGFLLCKLLERGLWQKILGGVVGAIAVMLLSLGLCYVGCIVPIWLQKQAQMSNK